jgi:Xaa-Pro aminopeptidase
MLSLHPVVLRGQTGLVFPPEEFAGRVAGVQHELAERGLDAALAYGDARTYAPLAWICGLVPMLKWAVAVVPAAGEVELYAAMPGTRDLPRMRTLAAVGSVAGFGDLAGALTRFAQVAVAGLPVMRARVETCIRRATDVVDGAALFAGLMAIPSERERAALRRAAAIAEDAAAAVLDACTRGATAEEALLRGDGTARDAGAHDVRVMWSRDGGWTLRPLEPGVEPAEPLAFYLAVETGGYWGEAVRSTGSVGRLPTGLAPMARLGLEVEEGVAGDPGPGFCSHRELDAVGRLSSRTVELP